MHHRSLDVAKEIAATHRARKRLPYLPPNFMDEALAGSVWCSVVFQCAPYLFRGRKPGAVSAIVFCIIPRRTTDHSGCISSRPRRPLSRRSQPVRREYAVCYTCGKYLFIQW